MGEFLEKLGYIERERSGVCIAERGDEGDLICTHTVPPLACLDHTTDAHCV